MKIENRVISNEDIEIIKKYTKDVKDTNKSIKNVNSLNNLMKNLEQNYDEIRKENNSLKDKLKKAEYEINELKEDISFKDKLIDKLYAEKDKLENLYHKFKNFWHDVLKHFQNRIGFDKDEHYRYVADDLIQNGIFDDNAKEIVNDVFRKVKIKDDTSSKTKNNKVR